MSDPCVRAREYAECLNGFASAPTEKPHIVVEVGCGGTRKSARDPHPSLWTDTSYAQRAFCEAVASAIIEHTKDGQRWWWVRQPEWELHVMTEQDSRGSHRVSQDRWAVSGAIAVEVANG